MQEISGSHGLGTLPNNVRYLGNPEDICSLRVLLPLTQSGPPPGYAERSRWGGHPPESGCPRK
jgi:hypothetical protein